jgi:hypothetical protein
MRPLGSTFDNLTLNISEFAFFKYVFGSSSFLVYFLYFEKIKAGLSVSV